MTITRIKQRRGTAAAWTAANPTLDSAEFGVETDTGKIKLGDGSTAWTALDYLLNLADLQALLDGTYAPLASPALTGTPTAPTPTAGDSSTRVATTEFVGTAVDNATSRVRAATLFAAPSAGRTAASAATHGLDTLWAHPIELPACTLDRIGLEVTTAAAAGGVLRLGIYGDDGAGAPGALILDAGTVPSDTTGIKTITISQTLTAGFYWLAAVMQTQQCGVRVHNGATSRLPVVDNSWASSFALNSYNQFATVSGALPASFGAIVQGGAAAPAILLRRTA